MSAQSRTRRLWPRRAIVGPLAGAGGIGLALAAGLGLTAAQASPASVAATRSPSPVVQAANCAGRAIRSHVVTAGDCLVISASGFTDGAIVRARLLSRPNQPTLIRADDRGMIRYRYPSVRSAPAGSDVLTLVEADRPAGPAESGNVVVTVPRFAVWRFRVELRRP